MQDLPDRLRGGLVVSCQPARGGPMDRPDIVAAMAQAAVAAGAAGLRIEGLDNLRTVRPFVRVPVIGLVKRDSTGTPVRITPRVSDVAALASLGADIVAYDATLRPRDDSPAQLLAAIHKAGLPAMADCATEQDGRAALAGGATILGTTLSGYTEATAGKGAAPDLDLVRRFRALGGFVMAEGRYDRPALALAAMRAGADCVTAGSAITRIDHIVARFCAALNPTAQQTAPAQNAVGRRQVGP